MKLDELLNNVDVVDRNNYDNIDVKGVSFDSRKVNDGYVFVCLNGEKNGNDYIAEAISNGAICIVTEEDVFVDNIPIVIVKDSRIALSIISKNFYGSCCDKLEIIMVTGTNGKTTTSYLINQILNINNYKCAMVGTNGIFYDKKQLYYGLTTPDPIDLHYYFKVLYELGARYVVMEASAHAIKLNKLYGIKTKQVVFTNISNEHLDYFKTMDEYASTKFELLYNNNNTLSIVNIDDDYAQKNISNKPPTITYGLKNPADSFAVDISCSIDGMKFCANVMDELFDIETSLVGLYNVYNILASITSARCLGLSKEEIEYGVKSLIEIPGRFNKFFLDLNRLVVVDFAHTPDGFLQVLSEIKALRSGRLKVLFGCVGYSDSFKRAEMGRVASMYADNIVLTTDNINFENFDLVCEDIVKGITIPYQKVFDRKEAIRMCFDELRENDTLILLGKGCETSNLINGVKVPHSDIEEVEKNIERVFNVRKGVSCEGSII